MDMESVHVSLLKGFFQLSNITFNWLGGGGWLTILQICLCDVFKYSMLLSAFKLQRICLRCIKTNLSAASDALEMWLIEGIGHFKVTYL